jgi:copper(I)-binding protein
MKRLLVFCLLAGIGVAGYVMLNRPAGAITLVGAKAFAMADRPSMFMVTLTIENDGPPDVLVDVASPKAGMMHLMNPQHDDREIIVPGQGHGMLAMDGAHAMMRLPDFAEGSFVPLTLTFANAGAVTTRLQHAGNSTMSHDPDDGVSVQPAPSVMLNAVDAPSTDGVAVRVEVENFSFHRAADDAAHVAGQGHAHLYLNGLKLGRLYEPAFDIGPVPAGRHILEVALNTNDHRPYLDSAGLPVAAQLTLDLQD